MDVQDDQTINNCQHDILEGDESNIAYGKKELNCHTKTVHNCDVSSDDNGLDAQTKKNMPEHPVSVNYDEAGPSIVVPDVHILSIQHVDEECVGTSSGKKINWKTNHGYSYDSIEMLPILTDLEERCKHRYSIVTDTSDEDQDLGTVSFHRPCACTCHTTDNDDLPSYDKVMMSIQHSDLVLHDDIHCTGESCRSKHSVQHLVNKQRLHLGYDPRINEPGTPCSGSPFITPGGTCSLVDRVLNLSGKSSPVSDKEPPNYKSLIFSIIRDEPPKYEEVTGKKLADELVPDSSTTTRVVRARTPSIRRRLMCIGTFVLVITITILLMYLSAAVLDSSIFSQQKNRKSPFKVNTNSSVVN